ncbi:beta-lactamase family protein [Halomonas eurihalina]|uniref:Beta-lactamase family protein n=1 Tax=Halomonas eurihalina TaxID=42566 RepID=A0A5D9DCE9_HALER|nr:serine hydrolase domain-containing protein [Halomonas eurihalina]MDR5859256.1 serine hydrolase [Halomonas eurihalina]TZG40922.1 beta-lactamase family protein [Halomonas eurihalina]
MENDDKSYLTAEASLVSNSAKGSEVGADFSPALDAAIDQALADNLVVGAVVMVARKGALIYRRAAGLLDREASTPMREDAIFRLASVTKLYVTVAAMQMVEEGKLALDDPVTKYLTYFRPRTADGEESIIRIRHLMSHTAGLTYGFLEPEGGAYRRAGVSDGIDATGITLAENVKRIASLPLSYEPGTSWGYSVASDVLGAVLEVVDGCTLPEVIRRRVTDPLTITDTTFSVVDTSRLAVPYANSPEAGQPPECMGARHQITFNGLTLNFVPDSIFDARTFPSGGGGMAGTAIDTLKLLEALRQGGGPLLKPESVERFTTNVVGELEANLAEPGWGFGLGCGICRDPAAANLPVSAGTWSWGGVYGHKWFVDPARELSVVSLTNTTLAGTLGPFPNAVRDAIYGRG